LRGYNGQTGATIFAGGGASDVMSGVRSFNTGIAARGHIYYAVDNKVHSFKVPVAALQATSVVSRKTHGGAGDFDIPLPTSGSAGVECRSGGPTNDYTFVFTFTNQVLSGTASVDAGVAQVSGAPVFSGNTMAVNLTGVTNAQSITVSANNVTDQFLQTLPNAAVTAVILVGDTNGNSTVNVSDVSQDKLQVGEEVTANNFRTDVSPNGSINASDVTLVKQHSGESVSAPATPAKFSAPRK
jgi:hypothetical protein